MYKQHYSIVINAPKEKVYDVMLADASYREWTAPFNPAGSYFEGTWEEGTMMRFLGPEGDDPMLGMASKVKTNKPAEFVSLEVAGFVMKGGEIDSSSDEAKKWVGALENYTFLDYGNDTELQIDMISEQPLDPQYDEQMEKAWPEALKKLKEIVER